MASQHSGDQCWLLKLPPELRLPIWEYTFADFKAVIVFTTSELEEPALFKLTKQIRSESIQAFYQLSNFRAIIDTESTSGPEKWIKQIPQAHIGDLSSLVLEYHTTPADHELCRQLIAVYGSIGSHLEACITTKQMESETRIEHCITRLRTSGVSHKALRIDLPAVVPSTEEPTSLILPSMRVTARNLNRMIARASIPALQAKFPFI